MTNTNDTGEVRVKPLEWIKSERDDIERYTGEGGEGGWVVYHITRYRSPQGYDLSMGYWGSAGAPGFPLFGTVDEAKAAAQADYEARILSAIEPPKPEVAGLDERPSPSLEFCLQEIVEKAEIMMTGRASYIQHILKTAKQAQRHLAAPPTPEAGKYADGVRAAAAVGYRVCAETRHVTLGDKVRAAIEALLQPDSARRGGDE